AASASPHPSLRESSIPVPRGLTGVHGPGGEWDLDSFLAEPPHDPLAQLIPHAGLIREFGDLKTQLEVERPIAEARVQHDRWRRIRQHAGHFRCSLLADLEKHPLHKIDI